MRIVPVSRGPLRARICPTGGVILDAHFEDRPLLRPYGGDASGPVDPLKAGNFPLVPFGNRVEDNVFVYEGTEYRLGPNTDEDRHYLHGDGWLTPWRVTAKTDTAVSLELCHDEDAHTPYRYRAEQVISVRAQLLRLRLSVTNRGQRAMPFGLGHHLFFPLTPRTTLQARAAAFWSEKHDYLPGERGPIPADLDFAAPAKLPNRWINNGFEGWDGSAEIRRPEQRLGVRIHARGPFSGYFLFRAAAAGDYFCFEPMTHLANAHRLPEPNGLVRLEPGRTLWTEVDIAPFHA